MFFGSGGFGDKYPEAIPGMSDAEIQQIRQHQRQARAYTSPNSGTTMADRLMGEIAAKYHLPNDVENLLWERKQMQRRMAEGGMGRGTPKTRR